MRSLGQRVRARCFGFRPPVGRRLGCGGARGGGVGAAASPRRRRRSAKAAIAVVMHVGRDAPLADRFDHAQLDEEQVGAEEERREREGGLGHPRPLAARERSDEAGPRKPTRPSAGDGHAEHLGVGGALHGLAAAGRADERRRRSRARRAGTPVIAAPSSGERGADASRSDALVHRASTASIAGTIPSGSSESTCTSSSRPPVGPTSKDGVELTPAARAASAARSSSWLDRAVPAGRRGARAIEAGQRPRRLETTRSSVTQPAFS